MNKKALIITIVVLLFLPLITWADIGPKPFAHFIFDYEISRTADVVNVQLIQCQDSTCVDGQPLRDIGPQRNTCDNYSCDAVAYAFSDYMKMKIQFSDGVELESNVFKSSEAMNVRYTVKIYNDYLEVVDGEAIKELSEAMEWVFLGIFFGMLTIIIEILAGLSFLLLARIYGKALLKLLAIIVAANIVSLSVFYFVLWMSNGGMTWLIIGELGVIIIETALLYFLSRKNFSLTRSLFLAVIMNIVSAGIGVLFFQQFGNILQNIYYKFL